MSELIIEELAEKIKRHDGLRKRLEELADLPVERVAEAILQQFDSILTTDLRREVERLSVKSTPDVPPPIASTPIVVPKPAEIPKPPKVKPPVVVEEVIEPPALPHVSTASIMEHFSVKEPFDAVPIEFELRREDWFYLLAFSYAPDSKGKGMPSKQLSLKGVDKTNHIFLLDFGDVRLYMHKLSTGNFTLDKAGRPSITPAQSSRYKLEHESILNTVRAEEVLATLPFWTVMQGREQVVKAIEGKYVELLTALIDSHDVTEWDLEVFAFDHHILQLPSITEGVKSRTIEREARKPVVGRRDDKLVERVIFREKSLAQEIHNQVLLVATKSKVDYMIRIDNGFMDDWKSILSVRYTVAKDRRKVFCQTVKELQKEFAEYELMVRVSSSSTRFSLME